MQKPYPHFSFNFVSLSPSIIGLKSNILPWIKLIFILLLPTKSKLGDYSSTEPILHLGKGYKMYSAVL